MDTTTILQGRTFTFYAPTGFQYTIREQNGADDDILSNPSEAKDLTNIHRFIASLVIKTDATPSGKLTLKDVRQLPTLDKYCILINSRIFSMGNNLEFEHDWGTERGGKVSYSQDLNEYLFDYQIVPSPEQLLSKPNAIPFYPLRENKQFKDIPLNLSSGKKLLFDNLSGEGEAYVLGLPLDKRTRNQELISRNLRLEVNGVFEKIQSFHLFSVRDMQEIRKYISAYDPVFNGNVEIENPITGEIITIPLLGISGFFFPGEI